MKQHLAAWDWKLLDQNASTHHIWYAVRNKKRKRYDNL